MWPLPDPALVAEPSPLVSRPRRRGRHIACPPGQEERFLRLLREGMPRGTAARMCGLSPETVNGWVKRGRGADRRRRPRPEDVAFARLVDQAEAIAEGEITASLVQLSRRSVPAAMKFLSTRYPDRWGPGATHTQAEPHPRGGSPDGEAEVTVESSPRTNDPGVVRIDLASMPPTLRASLESARDGTANSRVVRRVRERDWRLVHPSLREEAE